MKTVFSINFIFDADFDEHDVKTAAESHNPALAFYDLLRNTALFSTIEQIDEEFELGIEGVYNGMISKDDGSFEWASNNFDEVIWEG